MAVTREILWSDRKRYGGVPLGFVSYALTTDRLLITEGVLRVETRQVMLRYIRNITVRRGFGQRLLGVGDIILTTCDKKRIVLESVRNPLVVKELIHHQSEAQKRYRRMYRNDLLIESDWLAEMRYNDESMDYADLW